MKFSERKVIQPALSVERRQPLGLVGVETLIERVVIVEHELISDRVDRRDDAQESAAGLQAGADRSASVRSIRRTSGMTTELTATTTSSCPAKIVEVVHRSLEKCNPGGGFGIKSGGGPFEHPGAKSRAITRSNRWAR